MRYAVVCLLATAACGSPCLDAASSAGSALRVEDPRDAETFVAHPWPSDALKFSRGLRLTHFENPTDSSTLDDYLKVISAETDAFATSGALYLGFTGPIDPASLPADPLAAMSKDASVFLVDIDPDSPERGRRFPLRMEYQETASTYRAPFSLAMLPPYGVQLLGDTTYAIVVTNRVTDPAGVAIEPAPNAHNAMYGGCEDDTPDTIFTAFAPLRAYLDEVEDFVREDVVGASVFTTQAAVRELRELAAVARTLPAPVPAEWEAKGWNGSRFRYDAVIELPGFQEGEVPYVSLGDGGNLARDADGNYTVTHTERTRVGFAIPRGSMPASGWPVVLYSHGTGGSYESAFSGVVADLLARRGIATVGYDQTLHGPRAPPRTSPEITFFNLFNPIAARDNIRQGSADCVVLTTMLESMNIPAGVLEEGSEARFDTSKIAFLGHSQGGLVGAGFAAIDERPRAFVYSGLGAILSITLQERKDIVDFEALLVTLLRLPEGAELGDTHPVLNLIQTFIDRSDPIAYADSFLRDPPAGANRDFLQVEGFLDFASPARGQEAFAAAARFPVVAPVHRVPAASELLGLEPMDAPASSNVETTAGRITAGLIQYPEETHFPIFDNPDARRRYLEFVRTAMEQGRAEIVAPQ